MLGLPLTLYVTRTVIRNLFPHFTGSANTASEAAMTRLNWCLIFALSMFGLAMALATVWVVPSNAEPVLKLRSHAQVHCC